MYVRQYFVYILCNYYKTILYLGCTNDIVSRLAEHHVAYENSKAFTHRYNCTKLLYFEVYLERDIAYKRENQIKRYRREKKEALIATQNPDWNFRNEEVKNQYCANPDRRQF
ncbi:MAG: GIY-YIG nuclease family protein [Bacteroidia bacterium]